jgi:hypothetical protein
MKNNIKVIFLDIDGVMNSNVFYEKRHKQRLKKPITWWYTIKRLTKKLFRIESKGVCLANYKTPDHFYTFEYQFKRLKEETCQEKWRWLSEFCNEHDIKICISSVWKNHFGDKNGTIPKWWEAALVKLGFKPNTFVGITGSRKKLRGEEIQEWLNQHDNIDDYVILDDDSDMLDEQFKHFHHCDNYFGLTPNHLYRINRQFNKQSNYQRLSKIFNNVDDVVIKNINQESTNLLVNEVLSEVKPLTISDKIKAFEYFAKRIYKENGNNPDNDLSKLKMQHLLFLATNASLENRIDNNDIGLLSIFDNWAFQYFGIFEIDIYNYIKENDGQFDGFKLTRFNMIMD